ncbi:hypothetical protein [Glycomyces xiaoerkulensis]|uniref:hypothetical protein n=1 Tax=Glycomyces xiaoerkulensis TaxID=2038139 RepID=UPI00130005E6|nr:hypothetical protein [Glycomyces xiaoerkulensis]
MTEPDKAARHLGAPTGDKIAEVVIDGHALELFLSDGGADKLYVCDVRRKFQPVGAVVRLATTGPVYVPVAGQGDWAEHGDRADRIVQLAVACYWNCTDHGAIREARPKGRAAQWRVRFTPRRTGRDD